ncbi:hypothetical protein PSTG_04086 [Puccinia striiformis f. sp. tritici PST-78]|uniref:Uncharacterized protein n=1 Tax=Puccinia striiformis f. sp. tritici PST-78 TaxID=1165861 RepID=A0A0L0VU53_9BASI|nr:hypothetical protein PSTG_04086 [Puccinia striiformis f. sp. tritici PST-78]
MVNTRSTNSQIVRPDFSTRVTPPRTTLPTLQSSTTSSSASDVPISAKMLQNPSGSPKFIPLCEHLSAPPQASSYLEPAEAVNRVFRSQHTQNRLSFQGQSLREKVAQLLTVDMQQV